MDFVNICLNITTPYPYMAYTVVCPRCGRSFEGLTERQVNYQLRAHQIGKKCIPEKEARKNE